MTKSAKRTGAASDDISAMAAGMMAGNPALARVWADILRESARFVSERLQEDLETQKAMLACRSPVEMVQVQSEFFRKAMADYADEAQRICQIMTGATAEAIEEANTGTKRRYDDVPV